MKKEIDELINLAYIGTANEQDYYKEFFKLIYCNPRISFGIEQNNYALILGAYPEDPARRRDIKKHLKSLPYRSFLVTAYWEAISEHVKSINEYTCQSCDYKGNSLTTHHKTYEHLGEEILFLDDLIPLCFYCHNKFHGK